MNSLWLTLGTIAGYFLVMGTNPILASLRDGGRMLRRYPVLWVVLGVFGFAYALYGLGMRSLLQHYFPDDDQYRMEWALSPDWWLLERGSFRAAASEAILPALDSTAGLFNNLVSTFPLAALAALLLLLNWRGHHATLIRALRKRFGLSSWLIHASLVICAIAAITKPLLTWLIIWTENPILAQWATVIAWLAFLFEYLFGVCIQLYLILLAFCWVRGISFDRQRLLDFSIRRFSLVFRFAAVVMILSSILIDLPLILGDFGLLPRWPALSGEDAAVLIEQWGLRARAILAGFLLIFASVQITLTFHSESLRKSFADHWSFLVKHGWPFFWFLIIAGMHFFLLQLANGILSRGLGEGTLLWMGWRVIFPWLSGAIGAWLLGSWVSLYKRCDSGRVRSEEWIQY